MTERPIGVRAPFGVGLGRLALGVVLASLPITAHAQNTTSVLIDDASCVAVSVTTCPAFVANSGRIPPPPACWRVDIHGTAASSSAGPFVSAFSDINDGFYVRSQVTSCDQWTGTVGDFLKYCQRNAGDQ